MHRLGLLLAISFSLLLLYSVYWQQLPGSIGLLYLFASVLTYIAYGRDKSAAIKGQWRTKETTLQLFSLFGGWPGAIVAQGRLRHKSRKLSFQIVFWLMLSVNLTVFIVYYSDRVRSLLLNYLP